MLSFHVKFVQTDRQTDRLTDRQTTVKQYTPGLSMCGHKNYLKLQMGLNTIKSFNQEEKLKL